MAKSQQPPTKIEEVGVRLREERTRLGMNQADFAALGGVSLNSQNRYEAGSGSADLNYLLTIAEHGVDVAYILTGERASRSLSEKETTLIGLIRQLPTHQSFALGQLIYSMIHNDLP